MTSGSASGPTSRDGQDGRHHQIDRDDVDDALGDARELLEEALGVGDDDRIGHSEAADPSGLGLGQRRFDDRWPHDGDGQPAPGLQQGPLAERLGVGVGVGPSERLGPRLAGVDEAVLDPFLAESFGSGGEQRRAGRAELLAGLALETGQQLGVPAARRRRRPGPAGRPRPPAARRISVDQGVSGRVASGARPRRMPAT